jgi:oligopeptide transport system permease protein
MTDELKSDRTSPPADDTGLSALEELQEAEAAAPTEVAHDAAVATASVGELPGRQASLWSDAWRQLRRSPLFLVSAAFIALFVVMAIAPGLFTSQDPRDCDLSRSLMRPTAGHPFGYDIQGCDYYSRVIHGARVSIVIGILVSGLATAIGVTLGASAGFYGGLLDSTIARITDIWFAIPLILGAIVILTTFGSNRGLLQVSLALIVLGWPTILRLMRSSVLSIKELDYVQAARALGASNLRILRRHVLPNAIAPVIVYATITVGIVIAAEATLSFLGVGLQLPAISWGLMISTAQTRVLRAPHLVLFPGIFLSVTVFSFILLGDALRDALDPKLR